MKRFAIVLIVAAAAIFRLGWPGLTEFKADEARMFALALDAAEFKSFAVRGLGSSVGVPNFPISVWLYALPLFLWKHPYAATLFVAALNTAAVYACYRLTRRWWGDAAALAAALAYAVSPWAIIYSRKIWAQNLLPLFVLVYIGSALSAYAGRQNRQWLVHMLALAVIAQIHFSGVALVPVTAALLALRWREVDWRMAGLGAIGGALLAAPFAVSMLPGAASDAGSLARLASQPVSIDLESLRFVWMLLTGGDIHSLAGPQAFAQFLRLVPNIEPVRWLWGGLALGGLAVALRRREDADVVVALWLLAPILFFVVHFTAVFPHYFITTLPAGYMLGGMFVAALLRRAAGSKPSPEIPIGATLLIGAAAQAAVWIALMFYIGRVATPGAFGTPLGLLLRVKEAALATSAGRLPVIIVSGGDDPAVNDFPAVADVLFRGLPHRLVDGNAAAVLPSGGAVVVIANEEFPASQWYESWSQQKETVPLRAGEGAFMILSLPPGVSVPIAHPFAEPRKLANGVEFVGWEARPLWTVIWRPGYVPAAADYHFFNHAPDAQADGVGFPSRYWVDGDLIVSFFDLKSRGGPVRVGMYEYPSITNVPVIDAAGLPYSDALTALP